MTTRSTILWRPWSGEAFAEAHATHRPVLLSIHVAWSPACRRMDEESFADDEVVACAAERLVPVRVDADRRPDIADRYNLGGWPTTAFLTPNGECLGGGTFIPPGRLRAALVEVATAFAERRDELWRGALDARRRRQSAVRPAGAPIDADAPVRAAALLHARFDETWGGFGEAEKVPEVAPVAFAIRQGIATGDQALVAIATRTLDRIGWSALSDGETGAFHRACATRSWGAPEPACLAAVQADLARLFLDAAVLLGDPAYADRARAAVEFMERTLTDRTRPGIAASVELGDEGPSHLDRSCYLDVNARAARAWLGASAVLHEPRFAEAAAAIVERLVPAVYAPGAGVAHWLDADGHPRGRGLLTDQVHVSAALLDLAAASGSAVYLELAEELMRSCLRRFGDPGGGLRDRVPTRAGGGDIGLLAEPLVPYALNCEAARVLARLARETGREDLADHAAVVLASQTGVYLEHGVLAADYALAAQELGGIVATPGDAPRG